jgi:hypothetical protein
VATVNGARVRITAGRVTLTARDMLETGSDEVTDANAGKVVTFSKAFADVASIVVTPNSTTAKFAVYDFTDIPNPTSFTVYLFNDSGTKVTGAFSYTVSGW